MDSKKYMCAVILYNQIVHISYYLRNESYLNKIELMSKLIIIKSFIDLLRLFNFFIEIKFVLKLPIWPTVTPFRN